MSGLKIFLKINNPFELKSPKRKKIVCIQQKIGRKHAKLKHDHDN